MESGCLDSRLLCLAVGFLSNPPHNLWITLNPRVLGSQLAIKVQKRTMIGSSTSHLLAAVQCQHFINWEGDSVKQGAYLLTEKISFIYLYRESSGSKNVCIYKYKIPNHSLVYLAKLYCLDFMLTFILLELWPLGTYCFRNARNSF